MMKKNTGIVLIYAGVALLCAGILGVSMWLRRDLTATKISRLAAVDTGKETKAEWYEIPGDLQGVNQDNLPVKLSDLRGKVWIAAEFFAVCPKCVVRNGSELRAIYDEFKTDPDFHITCISVDPADDKPEKLADYAKALGADSKKWWFMNAGDVKETHRYLEQEMKFMGIRERTDPLDIESNGRYAHDMAFLLVNRDFKVVGKWNIAAAATEEGRSTDPELYGIAKKELYARIRVELNKTKTARN